MKNLIVCFIAVCLVGCSSSIVFMKSASITKIEKSYGDYYRYTVSVREGDSNFGASYDFLSTNVFAIGDQVDVMKR